MSGVGTDACTPLLGPGSSLGSQPANSIEAFGAPDGQDVHGSHLVPSPSLPGTLTAMICANCGAENPPGRRFCDTCGQPLTSPCPTCGATNRPGARFCGECGTALDQPTPATPPAAERRLVSVLF